MIIHEPSQIGVIHANKIPSSLTVVLVFENEVSWHTCLGFWAPNQLITQDKFARLVINDLLNELHGDEFFVELGLYLGYHQTQMKEMDIPKTTFHTHECHYDFSVMPF